MNKENSVQNTDERLPNWVEALPIKWKNWLLDHLEAEDKSPEELGKILLANGLKITDEELGDFKMADFNLSYLIDVKKNFFDIQEQRIRLVTYLERPGMCYFEDMLSEAECDELIHLSEQSGEFERALILNDETASNEIGSHRKSDSMCYLHGQNPLIATIEQRIATLVNWPATHGEYLQILRYQQTGEYRPHVDFFSSNSPGGVKSLSYGGQRVATFILYLSDVEAGGSTKFPNLGLEFKPKKGAALLFTNIDILGRPDQNTLHAGMPVIDGTKYIATKWLRERAFEIEPTKTQPIDSKKLKNKKRGSKSKR
ncbi:2OG-Fe(II) oxygenase [Acinetobacter sp. VNH17]|uniref:2OG-Fe(II) oxygenase n=2 Tax=Acinetobacter TaxID=469 RepID=A0ABT7WQR2_9GAMM|nr:MULTISPECIES: 2OG-Fe(II) oxygenase [Acinetobacter]MCY6412925.1 2OG-Fe(II) oxygenase [Acinetobacter thutiue]MDN0015032.1 2OG-Fe(II) oxygenase [Acinetobacter thutiue]WHP04254.1 2OG-Fe(II) oxygenase [Acinetobacter sp. KCTC 92772]